MTIAYFDNPIVQAITQLVYKSMAAAEWAQKLNEQSLKTATPGKGALAMTTKCMDELDAAIASTVSQFSDLHQDQHGPEEHEIVKAFRNFVMNQQGLLNILRNRADLTPHPNPKTAPSLTTSMHNLTFDIDNLSKSLIEACPDRKDDLSVLRTDLHRTEKRTLNAWSAA